MVNWFCSILKFTNSGFWLYCHWIIFLYPFDNFFGNVIDFQSQFIFTLNWTFFLESFCAFCHKHLLKLLPDVFDKMQSLIQLQCYEWIPNQLLTVSIFLHKGDSLITSRAAALRSMQTIHLNFSGDWSEHSLLPFVVEDEEDDLPQEITSNDYSSLRQTSCWFSVSNIKKAFCSHKRCRMWLLCR